jgi:hypothetical protein
VQPLSAQPSNESLAFNDIVGKLIEGAEEKGSVAEAAMELILGLKSEAMNHSPIGNAVVRLLSRIAVNGKDKIFTGVDSLSRMQIQQMANMAAKLCE